MYDATALMPIRASVLRRPASKADDEAGDGVVRRHGLRAARAGELGGEFDGEARVDGGRADGEDHRHRVDVEDVDRADRDVRPAAQAGRGQGGVDGTDREDRRDRQPIDRPGGVGDEHDRGVAAGRGDGLGGEALEGRLEPRRARRRIPGRIERPDRGAVGTDRGDQPVHVDDDRSWQANGPWPARRPAEQRRPASELDPQVHDDPLAFRVDRRVRDLGERLAQMVGDGPVQPRPTRRRRVVAHAPERLVRFERHRLDVEAGAFGVEAGEVAQDVVGRVAGRGGRGGACEPVLVHRSRRVVDRERAEGARLRLGVLEDRPAARLDQQQLARPEPATPDGLGGGERHGARLGRDGDEPVARHGEGRRPQAVPVDQRTHGPPVGEDDRRRSVPRRQEPGRPASQRGHVRVRCAAQRQRLRDRGQQRGGQVPAGRRQELEPLVERERIGAVLGQQRAGRQQRTRDLGRRRRRRSARAPARDCRGPC